MSRYIEKDFGGVMVTTTMGEKVEMQGLNDRLAMYIKTLHDLRRQGAGSIDSAKYHEALQMLENELNKLKSMYEAELNKLRSQLEDANREKNNIAGNMDRNSGAFNDMASKLAVAQDALRKLQDESNCLRRALAEREKENADLRAQLKARDSELDQMRPNYGRMNSELDCLRRKLEEETKRRLEAEDKLKQLMDKLKFDGDVNNQENRDLQARLKVANDICQKLEQKIRQLTQDGGDDLARLLQKLRDANMAELKRYQMETEEALNKNLGSLRCNMEENAREKDRLAREKAQSEECIRLLQKRINDLEGENQGLKQQVMTLSRTLEEQTSRSNATIRDLENKVRELEAAMMCNAKEFVNARDAQATLNTEINQYRNLLDLGQHKLSEETKSSPCESAPTYNTGNPGYNASGMSSGYASGGAGYGSGGAGYGSGGAGYGSAGYQPPAYGRGPGNSLLAACAPPPMKRGGSPGQSQKITLNYKPGGFNGQSEYTDKYRRMTQSAVGFAAHPGLTQSGFAKTTSTQFGTGRPYSSCQRSYNY